MRCELFHTGLRIKAENRIRSFLNQQADLLSARMVKSPRAVGDAIQDLLTENFETIVGGDVCRNYSSSFARRAMADLAFEDAAGFYVVVDVKTHQLSTRFNMPNLTSVDRLSRFYEDDRNVFAILMIAYDLEGTRVVVEKVVFVPIEFLAWDCLTIGALGWGQIQIANSNRIDVQPQNSRRAWMIELCDTLLEFYPREIVKIDGRISRFHELRDAWVQRPE